MLIHTTDLPKAAYIHLSIHPKICLDYNTFEINKKYHEWYTQLAADLIKKYGKDLCIPFFTSEKQDEFVGILILVSREDKNDNLSFDATQFSDNLKTLTNELNSTIKSYNESYASFSKLDFVSEDFSSVVKM